MLGEMRQEHEAVGEMLAQLCRAAADYVAPPWAGNSYRSLMKELEGREAEIDSIVLADEVTRRETTSADRRARAAGLDDESVEALFVTTFRTSVEEPA